MIRLIWTIFRRGVASLWEMISSYLKSSQFVGKPDIELIRRFDKEASVAVLDFKYSKTVHDFPPWFDRDETQTNTILTLETDFSKSDYLESMMDFHLITGIMRNKGIRLLDYLLLNNTQMYKSRVLLSINLFLVHY